MQQAQRHYTVAEDFSDRKTSLEDVMRLVGIDVELKMADFYARVVFA